MKKEERKRKNIVRKKVDEPCYQDPESGLANKTKILFLY